MAQARTLDESELAQVLARIEYSRHEIGRAHV